MNRAQFIIKSIPGGRVRWEYWDEGHLQFTSKKTYPNSEVAKADIALLQEQIRSGLIEFHVTVDDEGLFVADMVRPDGLMATKSEDGFTN